MIAVPNDIKALLKDDSTPKNFRVHFPNGEHADLTNSDIVSESVRFVESICSQDALEFGLCESPSIEFECVGVTQNIKNCRIECSIEVLCPSTVTGATYKEDIEEYVYSIPYGTFYVDSCKRQADFTRRKVVAYNISALYGWKTTNYEMEKQTKVVDTPDAYEIDARELIAETLQSMDFIDGEVEDIVPLISEEVSKYIIDEDTQNFDNLLYDILAPLSPTKYIRHYGYAHIRVKMGCYAKVSKIEIPRRVIKMYVGEYNPAGVETGTYQQKSEIATEYWNTNIQNDVDNFIDALGSPSAFVNYIKDKNNGRFASETLTRISGGATPYITDFLNNLRLNLNNVAHGFKRIAIGSLSTFRYNRFFTDANLTNQFYVNQIFANNDEDLTLYAVSGFGMYFQPYIIADDFSYQDEKTTPTGQPTRTTTVGTNSTYQSNEIHTETFPLYGVRIKAKEISSPYYSILLPRVADGDGYSVEKPLESIEDIVRGLCELQAKFGRFDRNGALQFLELQNQSLAETYTKSMYSDLNYDDELTKPYGLVICRYKNTDGQDVSASKTIVPDYNRDNYLTYDISNNYFIQNNQYTAEQIDDYLTTIGNALATIQYYPLDLDAVGLPYIEAGDKVTIESDDEDLTTVLLQRELNGIQALADAFTNNSNQDGGSGISGNASSGSGSGGGGSTVTVEQVVISGTELARITVDGTTTSIFAPSGTQRDKDVIYDRGTFGQTMSVEGYTVVSSGTTYTKYLPTIATSHIYFNGQGSNKWSGIGTDELINFSNYDKLIIRIKGKSNTAGTSALRIIITTEKGNTTSKMLRSWTILDTTTMGDYQDYEFDLKGIAQSAYLFMYCHSNANREVYIEKIELVRSEKHYLYNHGTEVVEWDKSNAYHLQSGYTNDGVITTNENSIEIQANTGTSKSVVLITQNPIDLSEYSYLYVNASFGTFSGGYVCDVSDISGMAYIAISNWRISTTSRRARINVSSAKENFNTNSLANASIHTADSVTVDTPVIIGQVWLIE